MTDSVENQVLDVLQDKTYVLVAWELSCCEPEWVKNIERATGKPSDVFKITWVSQRMTLEEAEEQAVPICAAKKRQINIMKWKDLPEGLKK